MSLFALRANFGLDAHGPSGMERYESLDKSAQNTKVLAWAQRLVIDRLLKSY